MQKTKVYIRSPRCRYKLLGAIVKKNKNWYIIKFMAKHLNTKKVLKLKVVSEKTIENYLKKSKGGQAVIGKSPHYKGATSFDSHKKTQSKQKRANSRNSKGDPTGF